MRQKTNKSNNSIPEAYNQEEYNSQTSRDEFDHIQEDRVFISKEFVDLLKDITSKSYGKAKPSNLIY